MSAASTPTPREFSSSAPRHTLFWPVLIFLLGYGTFTAYQISVMEDQLDEVTRAVDQMDAKVKRAQYEKGKFFAIAKDVLRMAPRDSNAEQIVIDFKIRELQAKQPVLMSLSTPPTEPTTNTSPIPPSQATNAAPAHSPNPTPK